jgi:hypothetical protein
LLTLSTYSRNALGKIGNGYCSWVGSKIPCIGDYFSFNGVEETTGCGIAQGGGGPYTWGSASFGRLGFANTGYMTTVNAGELVEFTVTMSTWHGGRFEYRLQDLGTTANADPDGSEWDSMPLLRVESFYPPCDSPSDCGVEPCVAEKTCAQIPMQPYGIHTGDYTMMVKIPDYATEHAVIQWRYQSSNSCGGTMVSCDHSEKFWNCAGKNHLLPLTPQSNFFMYVP